MNKVVHTAGWLALAGVVALGAADELKGRPRRRVADRIYTTGGRREVAGRGGESGRVGSLHGAPNCAAKSRGDGEGAQRRIRERGGPERFWDAKKILFAGRKTAADPWQIYEMNADGSGVRHMVDVPWIAGSRFTSRRFSTWTTRGRSRRSASRARAGTGRAKTEARWCGACIRRGWTAVGCGGSRITHRATTTR